MRAGQNVQSFKDPFVFKTVQTLKQFTYKSVSDRLGELKDTFPTIIQDESLTMWQLLVYLNYAISEFSLYYDNSFERSNKVATLRGISELHSWLMEKVKIGFNMRDYVLHTSGPIEGVKSEIDTSLVKLHREKLSDGEYHKLQYLCDVISETYIVPSLPTYKRAKLPSPEQIRDTVIKKYIGNLTFKELLALNYVISSKQQQGTRDVEITGNGNLQRVMAPFVLNPTILKQKTARELVLLPPMFFLTKEGKYRIHLARNIMVYVRHLISQEMEAIKKKHSNIEGDSMESLIREYLTSKTVQFSTKSIDYETLNKKQDFHFDFAIPKRIKKSDAKKLFDTFDKPDRDKPYIEIDAVAHHKRGFSAIFESKYSFSHDNVHHYYYEGTDDKMAEGKRLRIISESLNKNPEYKKVFGVPEKDLVVPIFVANKVGDLFFDDDGVVKVVPFEILELNKLLELVENFIKSKTRHA